MTGLTASNPIDLAAKVPSLQDLYRTHRGKLSDKWASYLEVYAGAFAPYRDAPVRILEIGIQNGGSLEIWRKFFPNATAIVGCDIDPLCAGLTYADPSIHVIVGDANEAAVRAQVLAISQQFDIIIDDGSHRSSDIIRSFAAYFDTVQPGGLYAAEDLHCSYWEAFEGGLYAPHSSLSFFKRLSDVVNAEHWGADVATTSNLSFFEQRYDLVFDAALIAQVRAVSFFNSICIVQRGTTARQNSIGRRVIVGTEAAVNHGSVGLDQTLCPTTNQTNNPWGPSGKIGAPQSNLPDDLLGLRADLTRCQAALVAQHVDEINKNDADRQAAMTALEYGMCHPWHNLSEYARYHAARALSALPGISAKLSTKLAKSAAKRDPRRYHGL